MTVVAPRVPPMKTAVLGTGSVGRAVAAALAGPGDDVDAGTGEPGATPRRDDWVALSDGMEQRPYCAVTEAR